MQHILSTLNGVWTPTPMGLHTSAAGLISRRAPCAMRYNRNLNLKVFVSAPPLGWFGLVQGSGWLLAPPARSWLLLNSTAPTERFRRGQTSFFRHRSFFRLVRGPRRCFFCRFLCGSKHSRTVQASSSLFSCLFLASLGLTEPAKNEKKNRKFGRAKTALIERFRGVKRFFGTGPFFRLVRAPRRWSFVSFFNGSKFFRVVWASSSLFSRFFAHLQASPGKPKTPLIGGWGVE